MDQEPQVSPDAETQNPAPVLAETPEVAAPETAEQQPPEDAAKTEEDPQSKAQRNMERRIQRLTAARYQEQARAQQAAQEAEQLRQRLAQFEQPQEQPQQGIPPEKVFQVAQQLRDMEKVRDSIGAVLSKGKALEGFDAACNAVNEEIPFYTQQGAPTPFLRVVMECEAPEKVLHHLGNNPDLAAELASLSPTQVARRLDRLEAKLKEPAEPKQSQAPKPIAPVKPVARDDGGLSDQLSTEEWIKRRNAQARA
jgi:hypothetical protein